MQDVDARATVPGELAGLNEAWAYLRTDFLRERTEQCGSADDYVALGRALLKLHSLGSPDALGQAVAVLDQAADRHPRSVAVWEHVVLLATISGHEARAAAALLVVERLDPSSRLLTAAAEVSDESAREWAEQAHATQSILLDQTTSDDPLLVEQALTELERWARLSPRNSTYAVNLALGLVKAHRPELARDAARSAWQIEDGSFADAYNIALVLILCGNAPEGVAIGAVARGRTASDEEESLLERLMAIAEP